MYINSEKTGPFPTSTVHSDFGTFEVFNLSGSSAQVLEQKLIFFITIDGMRSLGLHKDTIQAIIPSSRSAVIVETDGQQTGMFLDKYNLMAAVDALKSEK